MPSQPKELVFPLRGISEGWAFGRQPKGTCPDAQNVVPIDVLDSRIRGGQRWGLSKYFPSLHNGSAVLQKMTSIALSVTDSQNSDAFTQANGVLDDTDWYPCLITYPNANISATYPHIQTNKIQLDNANTPGSIYACAFHKTAQISSTTFELKANVTLAVDTDGYNYAGFIIRSKAPSFPNFSMANFMDITIKLWNDGGNYKFNLDYNGQGSGWVDATPGSGDWLDPAYWTVARELKIRVVGGTISFYVAGTLIESNDIGGLSSYPGFYIGFLLWKNNKAGNTITIDNWTFDNIASQSSRDYQLIAISGGDVFSGRPIEGALRAATNGTNALSTTGRIGAQSAYGKVYFCDGVNANYKVWTASTNTVAAWTPTGGSLPSSGAQGARYIALYRGRIVLAGLIDQPHNWYMSKVNNPLDWDYGATTSAIMAVAGNNTDAGECPDIITCLAPHSDDLMYIGGDHTLWIMTGDPADRGRIDNVSERVGVSGPDAFAFDPNGVFYFFGMGTIWKLVPGGVPEPISRTRLDATLGAIDLVENSIHLHWDSLLHGLFIFVVPLTEGSVTHYYWDQQSDSFWKIVFPNAMGPTTAYPYDADNPDDNALLLGGWDGYIRKIDSSAKNDDSTAISSYLLYPPLVAGGPERNTRINRILSILDTDADDVTLTAYAEDTIQRVIESSTSSEAAVNITGVNQSAKTFTVAEDWSARAAGDRLLVAGSTGNDGSYTLTSLSGTGPTILTVIGTIPNATVDGTIQYRDRAKFIHTLSGGRTTILKRLAGNAILLKLSNSILSKTWAIENLIVNVEVTGRTRKNQL